MERVKLWREESREFVGVGFVELHDEDRRLIFHIDDEDERNRVARVFKETGEVSWAWTRHGEGESEEHRADPLTRQWFHFVVFNILYPLGYQPDFQARG